jgi:hypothetical protein
MTWTPKLNQCLQELAHQPNLDRRSTKKVKRHSPVAKGFSAGVQIIRKLRTTEQLLNQNKAVTDAWRALEVPPTTYHHSQPL